MDRGESSRKHECSSSDKKPMKKARYAWEIKGKHHLKERQHNNNNSSDTNKNKCCIESFLAETEAFLDSDCEEEVVPKAITKRVLENSIQNEIPITLVSKQIIKSQDYYLRKWQAKQIARGFIDNTINSVLETWNNPPFDPVDFVDNCEQDGEVEDNAILMAIQSHGLQSGIQFHDNGLRTVPNNLTMDQIQNEYQCSTSASNSDNSNSLSLSSIQEYDDPSNDPMDFLNAAVSVAIQEKGLSYT